MKLSHAVWRGEISVKAKYIVYSTVLISAQNLYVFGNRQ